MQLLGCRHALSLPSHALLLLLLLLGEWHVCAYRLPQALLLCLLQHISCLL